MTTTAPGRPGTSMTIGRQVLAGYLALLAMILVIVVVATLAVNNVSDAKDEVIDHRSVLVNRAHELDALVSEQAVLKRGFFLSRDERELSKVPELEARYAEVISEIHEKTESGGARRIVTEIEEAKKTWTREADLLIDLVRDNTTAEEVLQVYSQQVAPARESLRTAVIQLVDRQEELVREDVRTADDRARRSLWFLWTLAGVAIALSLATSTWITRRVSTRLSDMSHRVDGAAGEILAGTTQQVAGFSEQAAAVQETVVTVDELVQTAEQSAQRARTVAERANQSAQVAQAGIRAVEGSAEGMRTIREQVHGIAGSVVSLAEQAQAISKIIDAVNDIAEQTHLLALNAAIEAARAGEHGRGFGVVAGEVKVLADQSRRATAQVADILGEIQRGTNAAVMLTESGTKSVDEGTRLVAETGTTIEDLAETVAAASMAAEQIAASSNQQAAATSQISHAMKDVDIVMEQNLVAARQSEETAKGLTRIAAEMKALVGAV